MHKTIERILKDVRGKGQITYKADVSDLSELHQTSEQRLQKLNDPGQTLTKKVSPGYPAKLSVTIDGETKLSHGKITP